MKRPSLAFGLVAFTMALLFIFTGITSAFVSSVASVAVLLFYFATKNKKIKSLLIIPTIAVAILLSSFSLFINNFLFYEKAISYDGKTHDITGTVTEVHTKYYVIRTTSVNNNEENMKMVFVPDSENNYSLYDIVFIDDAYIKKESLESHISEKCFTYVYSSNGDEKIGEKGRDLYYHILNIKNICNSRLSSYLYYDVFGVISGMLFGGTSYISDGLKADFRSSGVAHLLAVSGLHTSLWCGLFIAIFRLFKADEKHCNLLGILVLGILSVVSGFTPSVIRASFMMGITLIGPLFKKHSDSINSLGFSAGIILLINPYVAYSPSFYLSFLATTGVVLSSRYTYLINQAFKNIKLHRVLRKLCKFVYESLLISVFATLFTLPASVYYFGTFSIIAPLTNLLTVNLAFISMISVIPPLLISFVEAPFAEQLTELLFEVPDFLLNILIKIIEFMGNMSFATITANKQFVYIAFILSAALICIYLLILNKLTLKTVHRRIAAVIIVLPVVLSLILSLLPFKKNTEFTIFGNTNTPNLVIRSGNHYAIINIPENLYYD
ncbi:MAG: ComEC/Rec2 family competence protein, partial [Clostridia bacterium]|nr:ComEC/Rec2 family competence protein [Clostridia bacterium]